VRRRIATDLHDDIGASFYEKLQVHSKSEAVSKALRQRLVQ
jgi:Arc/MetJ family transcription regulator